jgi:lipid A 3-O-deacylase PagL
MRVYLLILCLNPIILLAQSNDRPTNSLLKNLSIQGSYQNGYIFPTNPFVMGSNLEKDTLKDFQALSLKIAKQTTGEKQWEQLYNYPTYGVGFYMADFQNLEELGIPFSIYAFYNAPFKRWERLSLNYEIGFGATFNWQAFDPITNKYNVAFGAGQSFMIDLGLNLQYYLTKKIDIEAGFSFTHFSNGALQQPNFGINTIAPKISLKYNFNDRPTFIISEIPKYSKEYEWLIRVFGGAKNITFDSTSVDIIEKYEGVSFPVFGISSTLNKQITHKSKFGIGMSISYDGSVSTQIAVDNNELEVIHTSIGEKIQLSIYPSYELVINRFSVIVQPAFYIYRTEFKNQTPAFYQRIGFKYHFTHNLFAGITLRSYSFSAADFIEWNIGYRVKWK